MAPSAERLAHNGNVVKIEEAVFSLARCLHLSIKISTAPSAP